jgi:hypothetical protein
MRVISKKEVARVAYAVVIKPSNLNISRLLSLFLQGTARIGSRQNWLSRAPERSQLSPSFYIDIMAE